MKTLEILSDVKMKMCFVERCQDNSSILFLFINGILNVRRFQNGATVQKGTVSWILIHSGLPPPCRQPAVSGTAQRAAVLQGVWAGALIEAVGLSPG